MVNLCLSLEDLYLVLKFHKLIHWSLADHTNSHHPDALNKFHADKSVFHYEYFFELKLDNQYDQLCIFFLSSLVGPQEHM